VCNTARRVIQVDTGAFGVQTLTALRVLGKKLAQVQVTDACAVFRQRLPCRSLGQRRDGCTGMLVGVIHLNVSWGAVCICVRRESFSSDSLPGAGPE
jgi:hypothetical protein